MGKRTHHDYCLDYQEDPVCPLCREKQTEAWEYGHESQKVDCESCGEAFQMDADVSVLYSTHKIIPQEKSNGSNT